MPETANALPVLDWTDPPLGMAPIGRFLQIYNRQLSHAKPAMEEWWLFGGFLDELATEEERLYAETMLRRLAVAGSDNFDRLCGEVEDLAAPVWHRRIRVQAAAGLDELQYEQTGARLAALAAIAALIGWATGDDLQATGFGTRRSCWRFSPRGTAETVTINVRVGTPRLLLSASDGIDLDFCLAPDEYPAAAVRAAFRRLAELTALAAKSDTLVDLPLIQRLEMLRQL
jgi:hypothetical protein